MNNSTNNFHASELAKFSALADRWWNPDLEFRPLHQINPLRLSWIDDLVDLRGKCALDVGCGGGILTEAMANLGADVTGIDMADKPLAVARLHAAQTQVAVHYEHTSAESLATKEAGRYDVVSCMEMLEHVPRPSDVVQACARLAKPDGWVFFSTLNRNPWSWLISIFGGEYVLRLLPKGTHDYKSFIKPKELVAWAQAAGLELVEQRGLGYNALSKKFNFRKFMGVGYLLAMRRKVET
jgi:2-polyprenyl-6-hydroxyphenyl methylase / 3-demethylubiquinone-9 3-methyltransferase